MRRPGFSASAPNQELFPALETRPGLRPFVLNDDNCSGALEARRVGGSLPLFACAYGAARAVFWAISGPNFQGKPAQVFVLLDKSRVPAVYLRLAIWPAHV
jgi:hypothetical protein